MAKSTILFALAAAAVGRVSAQSGAWGQCGGQGWSGATTCVAGYTCTYSNPYYSQCLPGAASSAPTTTPGGSPTTSKPTGTTTSTASSGTTTLQAGYSFIRAVEDPNFHQYLRSETINQPGPAVLGDPSLAAQFQITNGQLIQNAGGTPLYAIVAAPQTGDVKLAVSWSTTPASNGTFTWSGDTVEWSSPSVSRPQSNAWLVCPDAAGNKLLFVNLGPYDYNTPSGCADETIHAYTGATATP
ncbi:hypothetical protein CVT26_005978 [Gymnopilus dilepis]|uniref:CBM1 domain-containing protein n=1 Tax=Gymnopilus dilepis TaxID=231916 RepID=A0A409Y1Q6_9AGAR|nr:hypothetical protein CVT26_005978 [Gymnopilus dilepis]